MLPPPPQEKSIQSKLSSPNESPVRFPPSDETTPLAPMTLQGDSAPVHCTPLPAQVSLPRNLPPNPPPTRTHPSVVMVTMVYQNEAGMLVNLLAEEPFSA